MKVFYVSDLHLEFNPFHIPDEWKNEIVIIAGDVAPAFNIHLVDLFDSLSNHCKEVIFVAGNHEYYHGEVHSVLKRLTEIFDRYHNIHFLENDYIKIDDVVFVGCTLWTDFNQGDPIAKQIAKHNMNDFWLIKNGKDRLTPCDVEFYNSLSREFLIDALQHFKGKKFVVVTHHLPDMISVHDRYKRSNEPLTMALNFSFANVGLQDMILDYKPNFWIHGHTHSSVDVYLEKTRILCNPRGYKMSGESAGYSPVKSFVV